MHLPYIPDLSPGDYYLFLSIENDFADEKFSLREACENRQSQFFANGDGGFHESVFIKLLSE